MTKPDQGTIDSVHKRLLNEARETERPFNELLQYYAMEKFLLRMSKLEEAEEFVLKGALLLRAVGISNVRPTRDIDVLKYGDSAIADLERIIIECCKISIEGDGLVFDPNSVVGEAIREQQAYDGVRMKVRGNLGSARITIQIDVGFGDVVTPKPLWIEYPTLLDNNKPKLQAYTLESAIAEKYQAMVNLDLANSRMKDFYDIYFLTEHRSFEGAKLQKAIRQTFDRRDTAIPNEKPLALTKAFSQNKQKINQWEVFRAKISDKEMPADLYDVVQRVHNFLWPITEMLIEEDTYRKTWKSGEGWR